MNTVANERLRELMVTKETVKNNAERKTITTCGSIMVRKNPM